MQTKTKEIARRKAATPPPRDVAAVLRDLERSASAKFRNDMAARYGIVTRAPVFGTPMAKIKAVAKDVGQDHAFADELWRTGVYEARMLASMVDEAGSVTAAQMDRWLAGCDNWALVDTLCFNLFDRTPHAFAKVTKWSRSKHEFVKRGAFALLASLAVHRRGADQDYLRALPLVESAATDERNFVKKGVSWALRAMLQRGSPKVRAAARSTAEKLATRAEPAPRWIGKDALKGSK
jgi:3-methyladenine DNA glycosylase AlkD